MTSQLYIKYQDLITQIVPGPHSISYFAPMVLLTTALLVPPSVLSKNWLASFFLPIIYGCFAHSCLYGGGLDVISANVALWSTVLLFFQDPRRTYRRVYQSSYPNLRHTPAPEKIFSSSKGNKELKGTAANGTSLPKPKQPVWEERYPATFTQRIPWVLNLITSARLCNWKISDRQHDAEQPHCSISRRQYVRRSINIALTSYLVLDAAAFCAANDVYFHDSMFPYFRTLPTNSIRGYLPNILCPLVLYSYVPHYVIRSLVLAGHIYPLLTLPSALLSLPLLFLPNSLAPHTQPPLFGPFSAIYKRGLRGLWGQWWHQIMRYPTSLPGLHVAQCLGLRPGGRPEYFCRLISAFGLSGWIHMGLVPPEPKYATLYGKWGTRFWLGGFFWVQILGITFEVLVEGWWRRRGRRWARRIGIGGRLEEMVKGGLVFCWVLLWVGATVPMVGVAGKELGWFKHYPVPYSFWTK